MEGIRGGIIKYFAILGHKKKSKLKLQNCPHRPCPDFQMCSFSLQLFTKLFLHLLDILVSLCRAFGLGSKLNVLMYAYLSP